MPYIAICLRKHIDEQLNLNKLVDFISKKDTRDGIMEGELNYIISRIVKAYITSYPCYYQYNSAIGALECAKQEIYRRHIAPYEELKIHENGDI
jgi:hypothetical protein